MPGTIELTIFSFNILIVENFDHHLIETIQGPELYSQTLSSSLKTRVGAQSTFAACNHIFRPSRDIRDLLSSEHVYLSESTDFSFLVYLSKQLTLIPPSLSLLQVT